MHARHEGATRSQLTSAPVPRWSRWPVSLQGLFQDPGGERRDDAGQRPQRVYDWHEAHRRRLDDRHPARRGRRLQEDLFVRRVRTAAQGGLRWHVSHARRNTTLADQSDASPRPPPPRQPGGHNVACPRAAERMQRFENPKIICLNVELELKAERDNAEVRYERTDWVDIRADKVCSRRPPGSVHPRPAGARAHARAVWTR